MRVRALRADGKGRHTTVTRELHHVAGGHVIDSPGLRSVGLAGAEGLAETFPDVAELAAGCHFADCNHETEPGCAVLAAVGRGDLDPARLEDWRKLVAEGRRQEIRRDARLRAEQHRQWRIRSRAMRRDHTARP
jgi:ribosome biogenesis GTPase